MKYGIFLLSIGLLIRLVFFYFFPVSLSTNQRVDFSATLFDDPKTFGNNQQFSLYVGNMWHGEKVLITIPADRQFLYGQTLHVIGTVKSKLLKNTQVVLTIQNPQIEAKNGGFLALFGTLRAKIIDFCENNFSQPYSGLLVGIIFGIKSELTEQITRSFRITGLSHVVAASGMNVTLVAGFLFTVLGSFLQRRMAVGVSIGGILLYMLISGFDASIVRAGLMGGIAFGALFVGRQYSGLYTLFFVGACMLLWNPILLIDVGFQLSILATAGILLLTPLGSTVAKEGLVPSLIFSDDFTTTLAAQIATVPILLATFGQYSLLSILANMLVLWTIPMITIVGSIGIVIGLVSAPLGSVIVWLTIPLLWYVQEVTAFFATHALVVQIPQLPLAFLVGYYCCVWGVILFLKRSS